MWADHLDVDKGRWLRRNIGFLSAFIPKTRAAREEIASANHGKHCESSTQNPTLPSRTLVALSHNITSLNEIMYRSYGDHVPVFRRNLMWISVPGGPLNFGQCACDPVWAARAWDRQK